MASAEFAQREDVFCRTKEAAAAILDNPNFTAPEHPHIEALRAMIDSATLGILDIGNGLVHPQVKPRKKGIVIVPVLGREIGMVGPDITFSWMLSAGELEVDSNAPSFKRTISICEHNPELRCPVIWITPKLASRPELTLGSTALHEIDHAWQIIEAQGSACGLDESYEGFARLEISAYRLEQQVCFSEISQLYDEVYRDISVLYPSLDFSKLYDPKDKDKLVRYAKGVAFSNLMLDKLGGEVGKRPKKRLIRALRAQEYI